MTGYIDYNYPAFDKASQEWAGRGWAVLNPADHFLRNQDLDMAVYMRGAIHAVLQADAVAVLPNWESSEGATMEVIMAHKLGLPVYNSETGKEMDVRGVQYIHVYADAAYL